MPRRDGTGPLGKGAMTGFGLGYCKGTRNFPQRNRFFSKSSKFIIPVLFTGASYILYKSLNNK